MNRRSIFSKPIFNSYFRFSLNFSTSPSPCHQHLLPLTNFKTFIESLQWCAHRKNISRGRQLHSRMLINGVFNRSPLSTTSLINMYTKCDSISDALSVFYTSTHEHNVFVYNSVISGLISNQLPKLALKFYCEMRLMGIMPDKFTFPCLIKACYDVSDDLEVRKNHSLIFKFGLESDVFIGSALVNAYLKSGLIKDAHQVFDEMPIRDVVLWNAMLNGFAQIGEFQKAIDVYKNMIEGGIIPSKFTITGALSIFSMREDLNNGRTIHGFVIKMCYDSGVAVSNSLIDFYGKCKCIGDALHIFETMPEKDIFSWNSIMCVHEQCGDYEQALFFFNGMLHGGIQPDFVTITTILPAVAHLAALTHGREIHGYIITNNITNNKDKGDTDMKNALMDMYAKCGSIKAARSVFENTPHKEAASYNIMIMAYGMHGYSHESLVMFDRMVEDGLKPDEVTFVSVLSACSHSGMVTEGREFLTLMSSKYEVVPTIEHYTCVIDMLGRAGKIREAYDLIAEMPVEANPIVWRAFLAACRVHGDREMAGIAASRVFELEPENCGGYVLMSNVYGEMGRYEELSVLRGTMRDQNVRKTPGCSWIEANGGVHVFVTRDGDHPEKGLIYAGLNSLTGCLREHGYTPNMFRNC